MSDLPPLDEAGVVRVVDAFYESVRADALLNPIFSAAIAEDHWPQHLAAMYDFWSAMMLGTRRYSGRPLPKHMALPGLNDAHFARWLELFHETTRRLTRPEEAAVFMARAMTVAQNFRMALAYRRGEDPDALPPLAARLPGFQPFRLPERGGASQS